MFSCLSCILLKPSLKIVANSYAKVGSYDLQLGITEESKWLCPSPCYTPSPARVVLPAVAPIKKPLV